jgi:hypothetical protein
MIADTLLFLAGVIPIMGDGGTERGVDILL